MLIRVVPRITLPSLTGFGRVFYLCKTSFTVEQPIGKQRTPIKHPVSLLSASFDIAHASPLVRHMKSSSKNRPFTIGWLLEQVLGGGTL